MRGCSLQPQEQPNARQGRARVWDVIKRLWGYRKTRYRGLYKNAAQVYTLFALANLSMVRGRLSLYRD